MTGKPLVLIICQAPTYVSHLIFLLCLFIYQKQTCCFSENYTYLTVAVQNDTILNVELEKLNFDLEKVVFKAEKESYAGCIRNENVGSYVERKVETLEVEESFSE